MSARKPVWRSGPPPSCGWWPTKAKGEGAPPGRLRWWNGEFWSVPVDKNEWPREITLNAWARCATAHSNDQVQWADRPASWPERSRT